MGDLGGACFRMAVLRNLFHHAFHCLCHLFVARASAEASMLCPLLLDPIHPVITDRYKLMVEQPVALPGLPRAAGQQELATSDKAEGDDAAGDAPTAKRRRQTAA